VGAFDDNVVSSLLRLPHEQKPVTSVAVGRPLASHPPWSALGRLSHGARV